LPVLGIFLARFFATAVFFPEGDGDLGWQRWLGLTIRESARIPRALGNEAFTAPGAAWVPQEWLFSIVASLSTGAGWYVFAASAALCATAALYIGALRCARTGATGLGLAVTLALAGVALFESFGVRVQVFAWPFLALFLYCIELDSPFAYAAIAVAAVWSNVHASVMLAGPLAFTAAAGSYLDERWSRRTKRTLLIGLGALVATCCNPLGTALPRYAVMLFSSRFTNMIAEWKHTDLGDSAFYLGALPLLLILMAFGSGGAMRWRDRCIVLVTALLMFSAARNIPVFAIACFPIVARSLCAGASFLAPKEGSPETKADICAARLIPAFSALMAVIVAFFLIKQAPSEASRSNDLAPTLAAVRALPGTHRVLCADFAWCSFLLGTSRDRIFLDGRADPYPQSVWDDYGTIIGVRHGWDSPARLHGTDVIVVRRESQIEEALELSRDWRGIYGNTTFRVWTRIPAAAPAAERCAARRVSDSQFTPTSTRALPSRCEVTQPA
jgi:hypothetical protein